MMMKISKLKAMRKGTPGALYRVEEVLELSHGRPPLEADTREDGVVTEGPQPQESSRAGPQGWVRRDGAGGGTGKGPQRQRSARRGAERPAGAPARAETATNVDTQPKGGGSPP